MHLDLSTNSLSKLPALTSQKFLQVLKLPHNGITKLDTLKSHPYLHTLDLSSNQLTALKGLESPSLKFLDVKSNTLASLDGLKCPQLETICASNNEVKQVGGKYPELQKLDLSHNQLESLETFAKSDFPCLSNLDLQSNMIVGYKELVFLGEWWSHTETKPLPQLANLYIAGNPWLLEEGFDEGKHPTEVLVYLPKLKRLDLLPMKDEENDIPFPTAEQLEEASSMRQAKAEEEKAEAERLRLEAEEARKKEEAEAAAAAELAAQENEEET